MSVLKLKTNIMRNSITILTIALFFVACSSSKSQTAKETNVTFEDQLSKTLTAINGAKSVKGLFENSNKLKRLSGYKYAMPLMFVDNTCQSEKLSSLKNELNNLFNKYKESGVLISASLYLKDYNKICSALIDQIFQHAILNQLYCDLF